MRFALFTAPLLALTIAGCTEVPQASNTSVETTPASSANVDPAEVDSLARDFEQVAFYTYSGASKPRPTALKRVELPARFMVTVEDFMSPSQQQANRERLRGTLAVLKSGAGLDVGVTKASSAFLVMFTDQRYFGELTDFIAQTSNAEGGASVLASLQQTGCAVPMATDKNINIGGFLMVDVGRTEGEQANCVTAGISAILGLNGALAGNNTVAFSADRLATGFSERDLDLVRMAYDPRLRPGMTAAQARPLLPVIAADVLAR